MINTTTPSGMLLVLSAASGTGKTTLARALITQTADLAFSISHTTRAPRTGERDGYDYHFVDNEQFMALQAQSAFVESAQVYQHHYGTSFAAIDKRLNNGLHTLLDIDWQGGLQIKEKYPDAILVFIVPPSIDVLRQRLRARDQDDDVTITHRMTEAVGQIAHAIEYDYAILNNNLNDALTDLQAIWRSHLLRTPRQRPLIHRLISATSG